MKSKKRVLLGIVFGIMILSIVMVSAGFKDWFTVFINAIHPLTWGAANEVSDPESPSILGRSLPGAQISFSEPFREK